MKNKFEFEISAKASLHARLEALRKYMLVLKEEAKKTEAAIKKEENKNPKQLRVDDESNKNNGPINDAK